MMRLLPFLLFTLLFSCSKVTPVTQADSGTTFLKSKNVFMLHPMPEKFNPNNPDTYNAYTCTHCHEVMKHENQHAAAAVSCLSCHVKHGEKSQYPHFLRRRVNTTCFLCHERENLHSQNLMIQNHPVIGSRDPFDKNEKFSCTSCHATHSSNMNKLFKYDYSEDTPYGGNLCAVCHWSTVYDDHEPRNPKAY